MTNLTTPPTSSSCLLDWWKGTKHSDVWLTLAWYDIRLRYRRSALGPFWITLSMAVMILGMGPLYAALFKIELGRFFPHLALGIIFWTYFSTIVNESCTNFIASSSYLKNAYFPLSLFVWRTVARITLQFAHHIVIYIPIAIWLDISPKLSSLLIIPALVLLIINAHAIGITLGILCTRFRDLIQVIASGMQLMMFLTPIFWLPESLPERARLLLYNPFAMALELTRTPLLGMPPNQSAWIGILAWTSINIVIAMILYKKMHRRLIYWL